MVCKKELKLQPPPPKRQSVSIGVYPKKISPIKKDDISIEAIGKIAESRFPFSKKASPAL